MITVNGETMSWQEGMTIRDILTARNYTFRMLVTKVDGVLVKRSDYETTTVQDESDVKVIHLISGG